MAAPRHLNGQSRREPFPQKTSAKPQRMAGDLIVMAALIGISRALFGRGKEGIVKRTVRGLQETVGDGERERGRTAKTPAEIPPKGWKDIAWRVYDGLQNDRVLLVAAGVTFYALLALFPATAAIVSLYGLFADTSSINQHIRLISGFLPEEALSVIGDQVTRIASKGQATLGFAFLGTLALALWGANAGTKSVFDALNIIYKEREKRSFIGLTARSLGFTIGAITFVLTALAGIVAVPVALKLFGIPDGSGTALLTLLRWPLLYLVVLFALACLYRYGPSRTHPQWRWVTWGSAIAGGIWIIGSLLLSWYVANFGTYNATYGSLGAMIGFMVWMWLSTIIILLGGEINAEMEHQTAQDTTQGRRKPMGMRGARMADEIGEGRS
jgi:membrane protein